MESISITALLDQKNPDIKSLWYDWFCKDTSLQRKGEGLLRKLQQISRSGKFDNDRCYTFFKNNCPYRGRLYDDFRICDIETGDVIYTIVPKSGHEEDNGLGEVWGRENDFQEPLVRGTWGDIKKWFME